ncbi:helix-turn-helix domain-containing protein [Bradyrhizobium rifense]|uniref:helix-turn-helix domain-containing protein n=1 Tax=Bradyrhizobium rifense TaxID=515499 RepID=UPI001FE68D9B|nr:helix-turn-helix domain-containing protein [Bradyrhizobium rifense]
MPSATGGIARLVWARLREADIEADGLLSRAGLTLEQIEDRKARLSVESQIKFLELGAEAPRVGKADLTGILGELKIDLAKSYLKKDELPISQTAWLLGYGEVSAFTHAFRRWTGMTPRQWRAVNDPPGAATTSTIRPSRKRRPDKLVPAVTQSVPMQPDRTQRGVPSRDERLQPSLETGFRFRRSYQSAIGIIAWRCRRYLLRCQPYIQG